MNILKVASVCIAIIMQFACGSGGTATPIDSQKLDLSGKWNLVLTETGSAHPNLTTGLSLIHSGNQLVGTVIPYVGPVGWGGGCLVVQGAVSGEVSGDQVTLYAANTSVNTHMPVDPGPPGPFNFIGTFSNGVISGNYTNNGCDGTGALTRQPR